MAGRALFDNVGRQAEESLKLLESLGRYTRFVNLSKIILVGLILLLLGSAVVLPIVKGDAAGIRLIISNTQEVPDSTPVMKNPRFQGTDDKNQPYMVTADSAIQQDKDVVVLKNVKADMTFNDETWMMLRADQGALTLSEKQLVLIGNIRIFHDGGYEMETERMNVDMAQSMAYGDMPLHGQGEIGTIRADRFKAFDRGDRLLFEGNVSLTIAQGK